MFLRTGGSAAAPHCDQRQRDVSARYLRAELTWLRAALSASAAALKFAGFCRTELRETGQEKERPCRS
jgi:predicted nucleic acid-binding Zn ribbon protein